MRRFTDATRIMSRSRQEQALYRLFHENTKLWPDVEQAKPPRPASYEEMVAPVRASTGAGFADEGDHGLLGGVGAGAHSSSLVDAVSSRRSATSFAGGSLDLPDTARLLIGAYRVTGELETPAGAVALRSAPSAGGLYPIGVYLAAIRIEGLASGIHRYEPAAESLRACRLSDDMDHRLAQIFSDREHVGGAAGAVLLTARLSGPTIKYGDRGYRYVLLEAGHIAQLMSLLAASLEVSLRCYGAFYDELANRLIGVDGRAESVIYVQLIGRATTSRRGLTTSASTS